MGAYCLNCFERPACRHGVCLPCLLVEPDLLLEYSPVEPAPYPCDALPGTAAKIEQLALRYAQRQELFHPEDVVLRVITLQRVGSWGPTFDVEVPVPGSRPPAAWQERRNAA